MNMIRAMNEIVAPNDDSIFHDVYLSG